MSWFNRIFKIDIFGRDFEEFLEKKRWELRVVLLMEFVNLEFFGIILV